MQQQHLLLMVTFGAKFVFTKKFLNPQSDSKNGSVTM